MRARFTAFALGREEYVLATWHPDTRPQEVGLDPALVWRRLQIVDTAAGGESDAEGVVEFRASFRHPAGTGLLHERSRFTRVDGRWMYVDGDEVPD